MSAIFNGTTTFLGRSQNLIGIESSKKGTVSGWFKTTSVGFHTLIDGGTPIVSPAESFMNVTLLAGKVSCTLKMDGVTFLWSAITVNTYNDGEWHHFAVSWDLAGPTALFYVDRVVDQVDALGPLDGTVPYADATIWAVGSDRNGALPFDGKLHDIAFWPGVFLDFTDGDVLARLVSNDGRDSGNANTDYLDHVPNNLKAVGYGPEAASPSRGIRPAIYFSGAWTINRGTGGDFALNGTFGTQTQPDQPNPYRLAASHMTAGERWFDDEKSGLSAPRSETFIERRAGHPDFGKRMRTVDRDELTRDIEPMRRSFSRLIRPFPPNEEDTEDLRR